MFGNIATSKLLQIRKLPELELGVLFIKIKKCMTLMGNYYNKRILYKRQKIKATINIHIVNCQLDLFV